MTVEEYAKKVEQLMKTTDGYVSGIKLSKDSKIRMSTLIVNGNPAIVICETDAELNPTKIVYCMELADMASIRAMQVWLSDAAYIMGHNELQKADIDIAAVSGETKKE